MSGRDRKNLLDLKPLRTVEHKIDDGKVVVMLPRFRSGWMNWYLRLLRYPFVKLRLDQTATSVWLDCDGSRTALEIGQRLRDRFGDQVEPVWERLGILLRQMRSGKLIKLLD